MLGVLGAIGNQRATALLARSEPSLEDQLAEHDAAVAAARDALVPELVAAAAALVGRTDMVGGRAVPEHIPGVLTYRLVSNKALTDRLRRGFGSNPLAPVYEALFTPSADAALATIDERSMVIKVVRGRRTLVRDGGRAAAARRAVLERVLGGLLPSSEEGAPVAAPEQALDPAAQAAIELPLLTGNLRSLAAASWPDLRVAVLTQFGALTVGPRAAIERANAYYAQLVRGRLFGKESHTLVHPRLQSAFDAATVQLRHRWSLLPVAEQEAIEAATAVRPPAWWGANVRENRNARHRLSDHSFGWAVDFQAPKNPNIGKSGALDPVAAVTGDDPRAVAGGGTSVEIEAAAEELRAISRAYAAAMESRATLEPVLLRLANEARGSASALTSGTALLDAAIVVKERDRETALLAALWPEAAEPVPAAVKAAVRTLGLIGAAFRSSFVKGVIGGTRVKAASEAKPGTVAAHGFMNLPPALVGALSGSDAGGLTWLGTASVADFMHFQLADPPPLYSDEPVVGDGAHGVP